MKKLSSYGESQSSISPNGEKNVPYVFSSASAEENVSGLLLPPHPAAPAPGADGIAHAALVLVGDRKFYIRLQAGGPHKYLRVQRPLGAEELRRHLLGEMCVGSPLLNGDGTTRMIVFDADSEEGWAGLCNAAEILKKSGAWVWIEESPHRGGHVGIIFSEPVNAWDALATAYEIAPELEGFEAFPTRGGRAVRLPCGRYRRDGINQWCKVSVLGVDGAFSGVDAMANLLQHSTSSAWVTATSPIKNTPIFQDVALLDESPVPLGTPRVRPVATDDPTWQARAGEKRHSLYFHFLPELVAAWFNTRNSTYDVVKPERGRYARATWRGEAGEPSVCLWDEFTWTDFGAGAVVDSKQDGGDAFELYCRVKGITRAKAMRLLASEVLNEAKVELEAAALEGRNPARWVFDITSPAGWKRYDWLV